LILNKTTLYANEIIVDYQAGFAQAKLKEDQIIGKKAANFTKIYIDSLWNSSKSMTPSREVV
jgi:hypothetical protein